jgi:hypothetical protein
MALNRSRGTATGARRPGIRTATANTPSKAKVHELKQYVNDGRLALGALAGGRLVGIGVVVSHLRRGIAQLAFLRVSAPSCATDVGSRLAEQIARTGGHSDMVVSATPSENTVRFNLGRGFQPMADPVAELLELEPEDVHMRKML